MAFSGQLHMGYMGAARLSGGGLSPTLVKITSSSINPVQSVEAQELVQGDWNKRAWVYGKIETGGDISGPLGEDSAPDLFKAAWNRDTDLGDHMEFEDITVEVMYWRKGGRKFEGCSIDRFELSITAGEIANFTVGFFGTDAESISSAIVGVGSAVSCEKLITWDVCEANITGAGDLNNCIESWNFSVGNNLQRLYCIEPGDSDLFPSDIVAGIRDITGSVAFFAQDDIDTQMPPDGGGFGASSWNLYEADDTKLVEFTAGSISVDSQIVFHRPEASAQTGPAIYSVNFTGVCDNDNI